jgi:two-component system alkaline phosphatase synthesis response regulator PhoP
LREKVLVIEDEEGMILSLEDSLRSAGFRVTAKTDGQTGEEEAKSGRYDLIILDVMLPGKDGFQVCQNLREAGIHSPILMLTARSTTFDTVFGLRMGADDYLKKPFEMEELLARMQALLRRKDRVSQTTASQTKSVRFGEFSLDKDKQELSRGSELIPLNTQEYRLLEFLCDHPNRVLSRDEILDEVWGYDSVTTTRTVDVHVAWLRKKLGENQHPRHLLTIRGRGYRFSPE